MKIEELENYLQEESDLKNDLELIIKVKAMAEKTTTTLSDIPRGNSAIQDKMAENTSEYLDLVGEYLDKQKKHLQNNHQLMQNLKQVSNQLYRSVLFQRYLLGMNLGRISEYTGYEYDYIKKVSAEAIKIYKRLPNITE